MNSNRINWLRGLNPYPTLKCCPDLPYWNEWMSNREFAKAVNSIIKRMYTSKFKTWRVFFRKNFRFKKLQVAFFKIQKLICLWRKCLPNHAFKTHAESFKVLLDCLLVDLRWVATCYVLHVLTDQQKFQLSLVLAHVCTSRKLPFWLYFTQLNFVQESFK